MIALASAPIRLYTPARAVDVIRRCGYRATVRGGYLTVHDAPPITPGVWRAPRERSDADGTWRAIPRAEFAELNALAAAERDEKRNEGLRLHWERVRARCES